MQCDFLPYIYLTKPLNLVFGAENHFPLCWTCCQIMDVTAANIANLCSVAIALIFEVILGITTIIKLQKSKSTRKEVKYLFILSFILALSATVITAVLELLDSANNTIFIACDVLFEFLYLSFFITLLANLVARLHLTFKDSKFKMSKNNMLLFGIIFILLFLFCIAYAIAILLQYYYHIFGDHHIMDINSVQFRTIMGIPFILLFFIGFALSLRLFVVNIFELAKMQSVSSCDLNMNAQDIPLNARQQTILHLSAKYISLFYVASLSTILMIVLCLATLDFVGLFITIDICINLLCLHLQFGFAQKHYQQCCCCWDSCCMATVQRKAKKSILDEWKSNSVTSPLPPNSSPTDKDIDHNNDDPNIDPLIRKKEFLDSADM